MDRNERKAAVAAYKERKAVAGIYAIRCASAGLVWVGRSADLSKIENRLWFTLRQGASTYPRLQAAWNAHGREAFSLDLVEALEPEADAYLRASVAKARLAHWAKALGAEVIGA